MFLFFKTAFGVNINKQVPAKETYRERRHERNCPISGKAVTQVRMLRTSDLLVNRGFINCSSFGEFKYIWCGFI